MNLVLFLGSKNKVRLLVGYPLIGSFSTDFHCVAPVGNLLEEEAVVEAEEEQLAASVGIHVRGDTVFRDEALRDERDDSRFHWHRYCHSSNMLKTVYTTEGHRGHVECCMPVLREGISHRLRVSFVR